MKKLWQRTLLIGCCIFGVHLEAAKMHAPQSVISQTKPEGAKIRVLLAKGVNSALIEARGPYRILSDDGKHILGAGSVGKRYVMHAIQKGIRWGEEFPEENHLIMVPIGEQTDFFVNGFQYKGALHVYYDEQFKLTFVNEISVEKYLTSLLALAPCTLESKTAQEAFVIVKRTQAIHGLSHTRDQRWDVEAKKVGYFGYGVTNTSNSLEQAVALTPFMILNGAGICKLNSYEIFDELALKGQDARQILNRCFPKADLGITLSKKELAL